MKFEEKIKLCSTCKNRTFSTKEGLLCNKTMAKPCFEDDCMDYELDEYEKRKQEEFDKQLDESGKPSGFLGFFVNWTIPAGVLLTLVMLFSGDMSIAAYGYNLSFILFDVCYILFYLYFSVYTFYAFHTRKTDAVFIAKWNLALLFVCNIIPVLADTAGTGTFDNPARLIGSAIWCVIFFVYLSFSEDVADRIPKETRKLRKHNKWILTLSVVVPILLFISGIFEFALNGGEHGSLMSEREKIVLLCKNTQKALPMKVSDELTWVGIYADTNNIEYRYKYVSENYEAAKNMLTPNYLDMFSKFQTELIKTGLVEGLVNDEDPLFTMIATNDKYGVKYVYNSPSGEYLYDITISNAELKQIKADSTYRTSTETFQIFLDSFNKLLPIEYFEDCMLQKCSLSEDGTVLHYDLLLKGTNKRMLSVLTQKYITDYMTELMPYLSDAPFTMAKMNNLKLSFDFKVDCSTSWSKSVQF